MGICASNDELARFNDELAAQLDEAEAEAEREIKVLLLGKKGHTAECIATYCRNLLPFSRRVLCMVPARPKCIPSFRSACSRHQPSQRISEQPQFTRFEPTIAVTTL